MSGEIGVGLVGYRFLCKAYSYAYRHVARFCVVDLATRKLWLCGRDEAVVMEA